MNKDKATTLAGLIAAGAQLAQGSHYSLGHIGTMSGAQAIGAIALLILGWFTNKSDQAAPSNQSGFAKLPVMFMLTLIMVVGAIAPAFAAPISKPHALAKTLSIAAAPVVHPKRTVKEIAGSVLFVTEEGVDSVKLVLGGLDAITEKQEDYFGAIYKVVHLADYIAGEADQALEAGEAYFFGYSN